MRAFTFKEFQLPKFDGKNIIRVGVQSQRSIDAPGALIEQSKNSVVVSTKDYNIELFLDGVLDGLV